MLCCEISNIQYCAASKIPGVKNLLHWLTIYG